MKGPPIKGCLPEFRPPNRPWGHRLLVVVIFMLFALLLIARGTEATQAVAYAAAAVTLAGEVAARVIPGTAGD